MRIIRNAASLLVGRHQDVGATWCFLLLHNGSKLVTLYVSKVKKQTLDFHELLEPILVHNDETASLSRVVFACCHSKRLWATEKLIPRVKHVFDRNIQLSLKEFSWPVHLT